MYAFLDFFKRRFEVIICRVAAVVLILFYVYVWFQTVCFSLTVIDAVKSRCYLWEDLVGGLAVPLTIGMVLIVVVTVIIVKEIYKNARKVR